MESTKHRIDKGLESLRNGDKEGFWEYISGLQKEDTIAKYLLELVYYTWFFKPHEAIRRARRLTSRLSGGDPYALRLFFSTMGYAYRIMQNLCCSDL
ncbi:MAG: hypothetical protein ABIM19_08425 [candidate division WOR-3 bacterium]